MMDIVDSQIHVGPNGIPEALAAMDALGIASAVIDEYWLSSGMELEPRTLLPNGARRALTPTAELAALTAPERFAYLVRLDRRDPELRGILRLLADAPHARALRIAPGVFPGETEAFGAGDYDDLFAAVMECCGLPVFVAIPGNTPLLERYVKKFPGLKFIIDHCGMPFDNLPLSETDKTQKPAQFDQVLKLAGHSNVALKWAHAPGLFGVSDYPLAGLRPILRRALNRFGPERVMWASDFGANRTGETWGELLFYMIDNTDLSTAERANVLGGTARAWLGWPRS
jgi:predicted TIM-barrel fold metal-dependent hydrolase